MTRYAILATLALLAGCAQTSTTAPPSFAVVTAQSIYVTASALDAAEKAALIYKQSPGADPAAVLTIKALDNQAYAIIHPLVLNGNNVTADEGAAAQAALGALTTYLISKGVAL